MSLSLLDCLRADGSIDVSNYFAYLRQKRDRDGQIVDSSMFSLATMTSIMMLYPVLLLNHAGVRLGWY